MTVKQPLLERVGGTRPYFAITARVDLECKLVERVDLYRVKVRLLEAGAGLEVGAEIVVNDSEVIES
jgi:hypothetical protein